MKNFKDIAGYESEKKQLQELANVLKKHKELKKMGGRLPKGLLLMGYNGVGKSLMAEAFINASGLESITVNQGAKEDDFDEYIEAIFDEASQKAPCIILIEEMDKMFGNNGGLIYEPNYSKFSAILNTMNKYKDSEIFILGTANYSMRLDGSLIRSGRIDKIVMIDMPSEKDRKELFEFYSKNKKVTDEIKYQELAKQSIYFSCADIETVMNDATINACKDNREEVNKKDIETAITNKKFSSFERKSEMSSDYQRVVATHEAGHAVMMLFGPEKNVRRVSILPRGGIRGYAEHSGTFETKLMSVREKEHEIGVTLGGKAAESVFYNMTFDGSDSDMAYAMDLVHELICRDGYKGFDCLVSLDGPEEVTISQAKLEKIEEHEYEVLNNKYNETKELLNKHRKLVTAIVENLMAKKILEKEDLTRIFNDYLDQLGNFEKRSILNQIDDKFALKYSEVNQAGSGGRW